VRAGQSSDGLHRVGNDGNSTPSLELLSLDLRVELIYNPQPSLGS
jgi:hypothetical protein